MAVGVRLSADELTPGGMTIEDCIAAVLHLHGRGLLDFVSLVLGHSAFPAASTWIAPPPPTPAAAIALPAAAVRAALPPELPVLATTRVADLKAADRLVRDGVADLVGMTRALIADPELIAKTLAGHTEEVIECIGCNQACIGHYHAGVPIGCAVNARTGRELHLGRHRPPRQRRPAAARHRCGAGRCRRGDRGRRPGDDVTLVEREPRARRSAAPGRPRAGPRRAVGALPPLDHAPACAPPASRCGSTREADRRARRRLRRGRAGHRCATIPPHRARDRPRASSPAWDAIRDPARRHRSRPVADWGGGWDGLDAAERLAGAGREVTLACAGLVPGETLHQYQRNLYLGRLDEQGITILHHSRAGARQRRAGAAPRLLRRPARAARRGDARPRAGPRPRRRAVGATGVPPRARSGSATCWARARSRRPCSRARSAGCSEPRSPEPRRRRADGQADRRPPRRREPGRARRRGRVRGPRRSTRCRSGRACARARSRVFGTRTELAAGFAADGYARVQRPPRAAVPLHRPRSAELAHRADGGGQLARARGGDLQPDPVGPDRPRPRLPARAPRPARLVRAHRQGRGPRPQHRVDPRDCWRRRGASRSPRRAVPSTSRSRSTC